MSLKAKAKFRVEPSAEETARRQAEKAAQQAQEAEQRQRQAKLAELADKKAKGKLTLEDIDAKLDIVLEMLGAK